MKRFQKLMAMLLAIVAVVALLGSVHAFGAVAQTGSLARSNGGVTEEDTDVEIPLRPAKTLQSISIATEPSKLTYRKGEALDLTGLVVIGTYSDNSSKPVTSYQVSGFDPNKLGNQTLTVSLGGKTATFVVSVYLLGDADGNGEVTGTDAALVLQYVAGWDVTIDLLAANSDGKGEVTSADAALVLQYVAGWDVPLG